MTGGTKGGAQRARTLKAYVRRGGSPITATPVYHLPRIEVIFSYFMVFLNYHTFHWIVVVVYNVVCVADMYYVICVKMYCIICNITDI
jgi:hypothetical protein